MYLDMAENDCPHCGHAWDQHRRQCRDCGCYWEDPRPKPEPPKPPQPEYPYDGVISAEILHAAFWAATKTLGEDDSVHPLDHPYFDQQMEMIDTSGSGMPTEFWEHMARALVDGND